MSPRPDRIQIALLHDSEVLRAGLRKVLAGHDRIEIIELDRNTWPIPMIDLLLVDSYSPGGGATSEVRRLASKPFIGGVIVYTWAFEPARAEEALNAGAVGYLSLMIDGESLAQAFIRAHGGESIIEDVRSRSLPLSDENLDEPTAPDWIGRSEGLTSREADVLSLIAHGKTNHQIARHLFLSINSVKSYVRSAYRKIEVQRRSQAVAWSYENGLVTRRPDEPAVRAG